MTSIHLVLAPPNRCGAVIHHDGVSIWCRPAASLQTTATIQLFTRDHRIREAARFSLPLAALTNPVFSRFNTLNKQRQYIDICKILWYNIEMEGVQLQPTPTPEEAGALSRLNRLHQVGDRALTAIAAGGLAAASLLSISSSTELEFHTIATQDAPVEKIGTCAPANEQSLATVNRLVQSPAMGEVERQRTLDRLRGNNLLPGTVIDNSNVLDYAYTNPYYKARVAAAETHGQHLLNPHDTFKQLVSDTTDGMTLKEYPHVPLATYEKAIGDYAHQFGITLAFDYEQSPEFPHREIFDNYNTRYSMRSLVRFLEEVSVENIKKVGLKKIVFYNNPYDGYDPKNPDDGITAGYMTANTISVNTAFPADTGLYRHEYGHLIDDATCKGDMFNDPVFNRLAPKGVPHLSFKDTRDQAGQIYQTLLAGVPAKGSEKMLQKYISLKTGDRQFYSPYGLYAWNRSAEDQQTEIFTKVTPSAVEEKAELAMNFVGNENGLYAVINPFIPPTVQKRGEELLARMYDLDPLWTKFIIENSTHEQAPIGTYKPPACSYETVTIRKNPSIVGIEQQCTYQDGKGGVID